MKTKVSNIQKDLQNIKFHEPHSQSIFIFIYKTIHNLPKGKGTKSCLHKWNILRLGYCKDLPDIRTQKVLSLFFFSFVIMIMSIT